MSTIHYATNAREDVREAKEPSVVRRCQEIANGVAVANPSGKDMHVFLTKLAREIEAKQEELYDLELLHAVYTELKRERAKK